MKIIQKVFFVKKKKEKSFLKRKSNKIVKYLQLFFNVVTLYINEIIKLFFNIYTICKTKSNF